MSPQEASDADLVARARGGEGAAFGELIRRHHARIAGLCSSLLGGPAQADDAAQEVFLKAYQSLDKFRGASAFSTWLYRIASNHCLDELRKESRRRSESLEALLESEGRNFERLLAEPDAQRRAEDEDLIERALRALPPDYRLILTLRESQGLSYEEIMEAMDCSMDSVKARLRRARESLEEAARHILPSEGV